ncbi:hypothetical protein BH11PSE2_BH11PSE2_18160 [soil metagenome]
MARGGETRRRFCVAAALALLAAPGLALAQQSATPITPAIAQRIDALAADTLKTTGAPGIWIAVLEDGKPVLNRAYGQARLDPAAPAAPDQAFPIASISKQFTAAAILLLAEDGKLKLDDPVGRYVPGLARGDVITIRQILTHTAGYRDYWPQDYRPKFMEQPTTPLAAAQQWAGGAVDFEPGSQLQYSNTGFMIAGLIVEKVSGKPLFEVLQSRVFKPLGMTVLDYDGGAAPGMAGYSRFGLGPARPAQKEAGGWLYGAAGLAMSAADLAKWDAAMIEGRLLKPESWKAMQTAIVLTGGRNASYGLGLGVRDEPGRRLYSHTGEVIGYLSSHRVWPDQKLAIVAFLNSDYASPSPLGERIAALLLPPVPPPSAVIEAAAVRVFLRQLQTGTIDRTRLTDSASAYYTDQGVKDFAASIGPLGEPAAVQQVSKSPRGGFSIESYRVTFPDGRTLEVSVQATPARHYEQFMINAQ